MRRGSHFGPRILALLLLAPAIAAAQQPYPSTPQGYDNQPPPPPGYGQPPPPPPPGYGYGQPMPPPPVVYVAPPPPPPEKFIKLRIGVDGALAAFVPGVSYGLNFSARAGIQIGHHIGVYGDFGGGFGFGGSIDANAGGGGVALNYVGYYRLGAMGEFDFGPFFIALGPALFNGSWGGVSEIATMNGAQQAAYIAAGYFPALVGRIGFQIGRHRNKFTIAFENMLVFGTMTQISQNAMANGTADQSVAIGNKAIGYAPALMFGWDMR